MTKRGSIDSERIQSDRKIHLVSARFTTVSCLKAKQIIHVVEPVYGEEHDDEKLKDASLNA